MSEAEGSGCVEWRYFVAAGSFLRIVFVGGGSGCCSLVRAERSCSLFVVYWCADAFI